MTDVTAIADAARAAPTAAGVYFFLGGRRELLYVGKAGNLRRRLQQHARRDRPSRLARVYPLVTDVRWEETADEPSAAVREADLILALRPAFNASIVGDASWNHLVVTDRSSNGVTRLRLALSPEPGDRPARTYGCFPFLGPGQTSAPGIACSDGYTAFLRLLWAAHPGAGDAVPTALTRGTPPPSVTLAVEDHVPPLLHRFLSGTSGRLLATLAETEHPTAYLRPALRRDRAAAEAFLARGPSALRTLRLRHGRGPGPVPRAVFEALLRDEARASIGDFTVVDTPDPTHGLLGSRDSLVRTLAATRLRHRRPRRR